MKFTFVILSIVLSISAFAGDFSEVNLNQCRNEYFKNYNSIKANANNENSIAVKTLKRVQKLLIDQARTEQGLSYLETALNKDFTLYLLDNLKLRCGAIEALPGTFIKGYVIDHPDHSEAIIGAFDNNNPDNLIMGYRFQMTSQNILGPKSFEITDEMFVKASSQKISKYASDLAKQNLPTDCPGEYLAEEAKASQPLSFPHPSE